jgi:hypothetical protein
MSLLDDAYEPFVMMDKASSLDEYGSVIRTWSEGAEIRAAATFDTSTEARIGAAQGVTSFYTITTPRSVNLQYYEVVKRVSDGKIFRVTSDGDDKKTPASASLDMRQVTAAEWSLTS